MWNLSFLYKSRLKASVLYVMTGASIFLPAALQAHPDGSSEAAFAWQQEQHRQHEREQNRDRDRHNLHLDQHNRYLDEKNREIARWQNERHHASQRDERAAHHGSPWKDARRPAFRHGSHRHHHREHRWVRDEFGHCYRVDYHHGRRILKEAPRGACRHQ